MTYVSKTWPVDTATRSEMLRQARDRLMQIKRQTGMTYRELGEASGLTAVQTSNLSNWQATYPIYQQFVAWAAQQP